ncbi:nitrogenase component 1 [Thermodesulforhabdus norvegica]|uniref:Nitrogenase molybdenum-iron protein beta chain n=1 Tax=Thermodesulforhabdus norvegica TaxID=39841 RepID=A0A1I4UJ56_9BACT|nr:nitrogenase component 1 [Thermodesulforhabdus norvegica]SFM88780.1 nitrogenase molybdenum-iron protein beta chain [Thermodesulforhabdus norvegica]
MINSLSEIPIEGITYKNLKIEKKPITQDYVPPPLELVPSSKRAVCIDPSRTCMPLGAMWATLGVHRAIPFVQGAQGCTTYVRYTFARIFREPASIASASFHEDAAVFGGRQNLIRGIRNLVCRYRPELISIVTTCSSEVIGDDIHSFLSEAMDLLEEEFGREVLDVTRFVIVNTPSFAGSHVEGYNRASREFLRALAKSTGQKSRTLYFIPGFMSPGDIRELKRILEMMDVSFRILFDISDTLDCPLVGMPERIPYYPPGGTRVEDFVRAGDGSAIFALSPDAGRAGALWLEKVHRVAARIMPIPMGIGCTDEFIKSLSEIAEVPIPDSIKWERGILLDAMADTLHYTMMKRVALCGDPDFVASATRFVCELGMIPTYILIGTRSSTAPETVWKAAEEYNVKPVVFNGGDQFEWEYALKNDPPDLILGHSRCVNISREIGVPLVRFGFPVYDRVGYQRQPFIGYRGGERFLALIVNTLLDHHYPDDRTHQ